MTIVLKVSPIGASMIGHNNVKGWAPKLDKLVTALGNKFCVWTHNDLPSSQGHAVCTTHPSNGLHALDTHMLNVLVCCTPTTTRGIRFWDIPH